MTEQVSPETMQPIPRDRALVAVSAAAPASARPDERVRAGFLTQLIACHRRLPAYRSARLAEPATAVARYHVVPRPVPASRCDRGA